MKLGREAKSFNQWGVDKAIGKILASRLVGQAAFEEKKP